MKQVKVHAQVQIQEQAEGQVFDQVWEQVFDQVQRQVEGQVFWQVEGQVWEVDLDFVEPEYDSFLDLQPTNVVDTLWARRWEPVR